MLHRSHKREGISKTMDPTTAFRYNPRNADDIFSEFFGFSSPFGGMGDMGGSRGGLGGQFPRSMFGDDIFSQFRGAGGGEGSASMPPRKAAAIERALPCSLEDLYKGTTKKMKISRDATDATGLTSRFLLPYEGHASSFAASSSSSGNFPPPATPPPPMAAPPPAIPLPPLATPPPLATLPPPTLTPPAATLPPVTSPLVLLRQQPFIPSPWRATTVEEILTIEIKPGWKKGTKITFPEKGNEQRGIIPADLVLIIDEKPHAVFKRDGNDLVITQKISLAEALTGYTAQITTLDGGSLTIPINSVIRPTYEEVVKGEGMPIPKEPSKKGNLRIKFNIKFPTRLTSEQKTGMKRLLTSS